MDDVELLAGLEAQAVVQRPHSQPGQDSGYGTHSESSTQSSVATVRRRVSAASARWVVNSVLQHCSSLP